MDLIREIASERLVIMVTHNPELAEQYSTRIIRLLDGEIIEDTNPFTVEEEIAESKRLYREKIREERGAFMRGEKRGKRGRKEKAKMSFFTAFRLSARNLFSKRGRTAMVGFAGSIGIIGIALVLAFSSGIKAYIASMQDDMLSGNPIMITEETRDMSAMMSMMGPSSTDIKDKLAKHVYIASLIEYFAKTQSSMEDSLIQNDINENYIQFVRDMTKGDIDATLLFNYGIDVENNIYAPYTENKGGDSNMYSISNIRNIYTGILSKTDYKQYASYIGLLVNTFEQAPNNPDYILSQYNVLEGKIATEKNEIMLVIGKDQTLSDLLFANLGYYAQDEFLNIIYKADEEEKDENGDGVVDDFVHYNPDLDRDSFTFEELMGITFTYHPNDLIYTQNENNKMNPFAYKNNGSEITRNEGSLDLKVVGILQAKPTVSFGSLQSGIYYTEAFTEHFLETNVNSAIANYLVENKQESFSSSAMGSTRMGIYYDFTYTYLGETYEDYAFVGATNPIVSIIGGMMGGSSGSGIPRQATLSLRHLGGIDRASSIAIYPADFAQKDAVIAYLDQWNSDEDITLSTGVTLTDIERADVKYTDTISTIIAIIDTMINIVTYALIAFTSISLVVSTVMIGIITYVSVVERIKEIGVIRSLGGRKRDVSHLFNAETFILGLLSGGFGIAMTYLISYIASAIVEHLTAVPNIALLPWEQAVALVILSVVLTSISGIIPASSAAKKDPVVALRTE